MFNLKYEFWVNNLAGNTNDLKKELNIDICWLMTGILLHTVTILLKNSDFDQGLITYFQILKLNGLT